MALERILILGGGELGKEVVIEFQRLGIETWVADRYPGSPAMQVAHHAEVLDMLDPIALEALLERVSPDLVIPEIEAIATKVLLSWEERGHRVVPTARATRLTMDREGIRRLASEELCLATSPYAFADNFADFEKAVLALGMPCVVKPVMSSSGKGQSVIKTSSDIQNSWNYAQEGGRAGKGKVIVEGFVRFDYEITLLTVSAVDGIHFCQPIGHRQEDGDYRESWQPQPMGTLALARAQEIARAVVTELGGWGIFGVELFVRGEEVLFSEVSPRPHDTGLVTLVSQNLSEFALHVRAVLGLPILGIEQRGPSASAVILPRGESKKPRFEGLDQALLVPGTELRIFGKPEIAGRRRMGVALAKGGTIEEAKDRAILAASRVRLIP